MSALLLEGFALGLSTGLYCLGACAPLFVPYLLAEARQGLRPNALVILEFLAGRLAAYLLFAAGASLLGQKAGAVPGWLLGAGIFLSGVLLSLYAVARNAPHLSFCLPLSRALGAARLPFLFGFLVGINVCPPFTAGLVRLLALRDLPAGVLYFSAFFLGTTLYMLPMLATAPLSRVQRLRGVASIASALSGLWFMGLGLSKIL